MTTRWKITVGELCKGLAFKQDGHWIWRPGVTSDSQHDFHFDRLQEMADVQRFLAELYSTKPNKVGFTRYRRKI